MSNFSAWTVSSLCPESEIFSKVLHIYKSIIRSGFEYFCRIQYILSYFIKSKEESANLLVLSWHHGFSLFPNDVMSFASAFSINTFNVICSRERSSILHRHCGVKRSMWFGKRVSSFYSLIS